ncbi:MAG TPA: DUF1800 domain-containing protein [Pyrinomonadaceae bacterium]|nr:DUF1800 domain-containing protein [Pyrinomonadaceae bacterium]
MRSTNNGLFARRNGIAIRVITFVSTSALLFSTLMPGVSAQQKATQSRALNDEQRILHVLNRLGFGARPGDVARVKAIGLDNYINQQLNPQKVSDTVADAKISDLSTLDMTTAQLYEKFPQPGQLIKQMERRGELPAELAAARDNRVKAGAEPATNQPPAGEAMEMPANNGEAKKDADTSNENPNPRDSPKYRQALREYYQQHGLQLPQRISAELQASRILRAVYSERQLQEVMVDFWTNHFNVFAGKGADRWLLTAYDRDTIRPNTMGKFSDLLLATAQSPAMLFYLDNFQSVSPDSPKAQTGPGPGQHLRNQQRGGLLGGLMQRNPEEGTPQRPANTQRQRRGINENYARELMELHTLGVDGGYTQKDVQEVARCFTGWTIFAPRGAGAATQAMLNGPRADMLRENAGKFFFNPRTHDDGEKIVLGHKIPAGGGIKDGLTVLDILAHSQATAKFVATKLVRHFVSDSPPPGLVDRVAATFTKTDGDIREVLRAIFFSPEFNSADAYRAKIKRPFELTISAIRTLGGETTGGPPLHQWIARMGEPLYGFQTPNGYSDQAESWVNTGGLLERFNFGLTLASNRIPGTRVDLKQFVSSGDGRSLNKDQIMDRFLDLIVAGDITPKTKAALLKQLDEQATLIVPAISSETSRSNDGMANESNSSMDREPPFRQRGQRQQLARADANISDPMTKIVGLILGSPEFQRQ